MHRFRIQFSAVFWLVLATAAALALTLAWTWHAHEQRRQERLTALLQIESDRKATSQQIEAYRDRLSGAPPAGVASWNEVFEHLGQNLKPFDTDFESGSGFGCQSGDGEISGTNQPLVPVLDFRQQIAGKAGLATRTDSVSVSFRHVSYTSGKLADLDEDEDVLRRELQAARSGQSSNPGAIPTFTVDECRKFSAFAAWLVEKNPVDAVDPFERYEKSRKRLTRSLLADPSNPEAAIPGKVRVVGVFLANSRQARANFPAYGRNASTWPDYDPRQRPWWVIFQGRSGHEVTVFHKKCRLTKVYKDMGLGREDVRTLACLMQDGTNSSVGTPKWILGFDIASDNPPPSLGGLGGEKLEAVRQDSEPKDIFQLAHLFLAVPTPGVFGSAAKLWLVGLATLFLAGLPFGRTKRSLTARRLFVLLPDRPTMTIKDIRREIEESTLDISFGLGSLFRHKVSHRATKVADRVTENLEDLRLDVLKRPEVRGRERWLVQESTEYRWPGCRITLLAHPPTLAKVTHKSRSEPDVVTEGGSIATDRARSFLLRRLSKDFGWTDSSRSLRLRLGEVDLVRSGVGAYGRVRFFDVVGGALDNLYDGRDVDAVVQWAFLESVLRYRDGELPSFLFSGARVDRTLLFADEDALQHAETHYTETLARLHERYQVEGGVLYVATLEDAPLPLQAFTEMTFTLLDREELLVTRSLLHGKPLIGSSGDLWAEGYFSRKPADVKFFSALYDKIERREWNAGRSAQVPRPATAELAAREGEASGWLADGARRGASDGDAGRPGTDQSM